MVPFNFSANVGPAYSGAPVGTGSSSGNINTGSQFSFGGTNWPFQGGTTPFDTVFSGAAGASPTTPWKYAAVGLGVLFVLLVTHSLHLRK